MTRYTTIEHPEAFQGSRRYALTATRQTARAHPVGPHILGFQTEPDNPVEKTRRRIAVACSRCRKRKIKCSGDPKNGQGCQNCRNAGTDPGQCQFLRVQSSSVEWGSDWPYLLNTAPPFNTNPPPLGMYGGGGGAVPPPPPPYPPSAPSPRRLPSYPYPYPPMPGPGEVYSYEMSPPDTIFEQPYSINPPPQSYVLPEHHSSFYNHDVLRQWQGYPRPERGPPGSFEQLPATTSYNASGVNYSTSLAPITTIDPTSGFPSMGTLAKSLPPSQQTQAPERVLPTPRTSISHGPHEPQQSSYAEMYNNTNATRTLVSWTNHTERPTLPTGHVGAVPSSSGGSPHHGPHENKSLTSSPHPHPEYSCTSMVSSNVSAPVTDTPISAPGFSLGMLSTAGPVVEDGNTLLYSATHPVGIPTEVHPESQSHAHAHHLRARVPSTGSFTFSTSASTESEGSKRGSISSSGTEATLLHRPTNYAVHHLRHIQSQPQDHAPQGQVQDVRKGSVDEQNDAERPRSFRAEGRE